MIRVQAKEQLTCFGKDQQRKIDKIIFRNEKKNFTTNWSWRSWKLKKLFDYVGNGVMFGLFLKLS